MGNALQRKALKSEAKLARKELKRELRESIKRDALENDKGYYGFLLTMVAGSLPITFILGAVTAYAIGYDTGTDLRWLGLMPVALQGAVVPHTRALVYRWKLKRGLVSFAGRVPSDIGDLKAESLRKKLA